MKRLILFGLVVGLLAIGLCPGTFAKTVTVNSGGGADHTTLTAALTDVQSAADGADVITIQNAGPFFEGQLLINNSANAADLTIEALAGVRPIVVLDYNGDGAIRIQKNGPTAISDLIIIPAVGDAATRPQAAIYIDEDAATDLGFSVTLDNLLITSNNGSNAPACALDGSSFTYSAGTTTTFRDEGIYVLSQAVTTQIHSVYMNDVVICGLFGDQGSDGFRTLQDGAAGSEFVVGPGCVASFLTAGTSNGAVQPGGNEGTTHIVKIQGTQDKPVRIVNNDTNGIACTSTTLAGSWKALEWVIIANNTLAGLTTSDSDESISFANVTIANNGIEAINATNAFAGLYTAENCIIAGAGIDGTTKVIDVSTSAAGILAVTDSAIVLQGPYKLDTANFDFDGLDDNTPTSNVTLSNVTTLDPDFLSLDITDPDFASVSNPAFAVLGPSGGPLTGGGKFDLNIRAWTEY